MRILLVLGLLQVSLCINFFEIANSTSLFSNDIAELVLPEFNIFPSACTFIGEFQNFGLTVNRIESDQ